MNFKMQRLVCLLLVFVGAACTQKVNEDSQKEKVQESTEAVSPPLEVDTVGTDATEKHECTALRMSSDKPSAIWKMKNGKHLIVCNLSEYDKMSDNKVKGWINIYERPISHQKGYIKEVDSEMPSSQITFQVEKQSDTVVLVTKYIRDPKSSPEESYDVSATQFKIDCSEKECLKTKEVCVYEKPKKSGEPKILEYVESITKGKETNLEKFGYYDTVIDSVMNAALSGDQRAIKLVLETSADKFKVDGAAGESFSDGYRVLSNLVELGCIKK